MAPSPFITEYAVRETRSSRERRLAIGACAALSMLFLVPKAGATPRSSGPSSYQEGAVIKAFKSQGLPLFDPAFGQPDAVKVLSSVKPHDGWKLGIYVYPTTKFAEASFLGGTKQWSASGIAALRLKNLVVTAVPSGATITKKARTFPMPKLVLAALGALPGA